MKSIQKNTKEKGFINTIVLILLALILLKYFFNFSIFDYINPYKLWSIIMSILNPIIVFWNNYLVPIFAYFWNHIIMNILWPVIRPIVNKINSQR